MVPCPRTLRQRAGRAGNGGGSYASAEDLLAAVEQRFGGETADTVRRSIEAQEHPRAVTGDDMAVLLDAAAPVLQDLLAFGGTVPEFLAEAHEDRGPETICAWIRQPGGGRGGVKFVQFPALQLLGQRQDPRRLRAGQPEGHTLTRAARRRAAIFLALCCPAPGHSVLALSVAALGFAEHGAGHVVGGISRVRWADVPLPPALSQGIRMSI